VSPRLQHAWQFLRLQAGELCQPLAQSIEAQHSRLQVAQMDRHGVQVSLQQLFFLIRLMLIDGHNRL